MSPNFRVVQPKPPPSVRPAIPVVEFTPVGTSSPCSWVARSTSASVAPGSTRAVRAWATVTRFALEIDDEPAIDERAARDVVAAALDGEPQAVARANATARTTSSSVATRAMTPGRRSIIAFQTVLAAAYPSLSGYRICPPSALSVIVLSSFRLDPSSFFSVRVPTLRSPIELVRCTPRWRILSLGALSGNVQSSVIHARSSAGGA